MLNPIGFGLAAMAATASLAWAGGDDEKNKNNSTLTTLAAPQDKKEGTSVSAKAGDGVKFEADNFSLALNNRLQLQWRYLWNEDNPDQNTFRVRRARTVLEGMAFKKELTYKLQMDWVETNAIKDAWARWAFYKADDYEIALRFGQQKTYFGREATGSSGNLEFVDRALASSTFSNARARGAMVQGSHGEDGMVQWTLGAFNTDSAAGSTNSNEEAANVDNELNYVLSVWLSPNGSKGLAGEGYSQGDLDRSDKLLYSVGAALEIGNNKANPASATSTDVDTLSINLNAALKTGGIHAMADVFIREDETDPAAGASVTADSMGWQAQVSYTLEPQEKDGPQWSFGARYGMIKIDDAPIVMVGSPLGTLTGDVSELEVMLTNYYKKHKMKTQVGWVLQSIEPDLGGDVDNHRFEVQFTLAF